MTDSAELAFTRLAGVVVVGGGIRPIPGCPRRRGAPHQAGFTEILFRRLRPEESG
jgi:hypothetical protein